MKSILSVVATLILACMFNTHAAAQIEAWQAAFKSIKWTNGADRICYNYKVILADGSTNRRLDSTAGKIYKNGVYYLDSNSTVLNMRDAEYTLQINNPKRVAYVRTIKNITARQKSPNANAQIALVWPEAIKPANVEAFSNKSLPNGQTMLSATFRGLEISAIEIVLDASEHVVSIKSTMPDKSAEGGTLQRILMLDHFSESFNTAVIDTHRYLKSVPSGFTLVGKGNASYKVIKII